MININIPQDIHNCLVAIHLFIEIGIFSKAASGGVL